MKGRLEPMKTVLRIVLGRALVALPASSLLALASSVWMGSPVVAQSAISASGVVESKTGGFKFPDGSIQTGAATPLGECPTMDPTDEMIWVGGVCIDRYEASVWSEPDGGTQYGASSDDYPCANNGQDCDNIYARSVPGVTPSRYITWFQAQAALTNSGKRLPTSAEWQMAVRGMPDDTGSITPCNTRSGDIRNTGADPGCVSDWGAYDMVGNVWEWVADRVPHSTGCPGWGTFSQDIMCLSPPPRGRDPEPWLVAAIGTTDTTRGRCRSTAACFRPARISSSAFAAPASRNESR